MSPWGIGVGDIIKDFNEKLQREREEVKRLREVLVNVFWMTGGVATVDMSKTTKDILNYLERHVHIDEY